MADNTVAELTALLNQARELDPLSEGAQIEALFNQCLILADRQQRPKPWAFVNAMFGDMLSAGNPSLARMAYENALELLDSESDHEIWLACQGGLGLVLMSLGVSDPELLEAALEHLEAAVREDPDFASGLALLYSYRIKGDRAANWTRRIEYLELALSNVDRQVDPEQWARCNNELALAYSAEPNADFAKQIEKRLNAHQESLTILGTAHGENWIRTQIWLSECWSARVQGEHAENLDVAELCARSALDACSVHISPETHRMALQAVASASFSRRPKVGVERATDALSLLDRAHTLIDSELQPEAYADIERSKALVLLKLIQIGQHHQINELVICTRHARQAIGTRLPKRLLVLYRIEADARIECGDFDEAVEPLNEAINLGQLILAESDSVAGRLETIHNIGDAAALLCYSYIKSGQINQALTALESGKGLLWSGGNDGSSVQQMGQLIPNDGALLFACFAGPIGYVIVVTKFSLEAIPLPRLGRPQLMQLQRGGLDATELGGWLYDYAFGQSDSEHWHRAILAMGNRLYIDLWQPVLEHLDKVNVKSGAELVWFHQGGSAVLPIHAAWAGDESDPDWLIDHYALRYSPSLQALLIGSAIHSQSSTLLIVSDPNQNLHTEKLGSVAIASVADSMDTSKTVILEGQRATRSSVLEHLPKARVAHFAAHASPDFEDPWNSRLYLAGAEVLTLIDCLKAIASSSPSIVSLSACDSGNTRVTSHADEFISFPSAFMYAGTRTVVATLWRADDWACGLIIRQFYLELAKGLSSAEALRCAQMWLRTVTNSQLLDLLKQIKIAGEEDADTASEMRFWVKQQSSPDKRSFEHPYFWGAFTVSGRGD